MLCMNEQLNAYMAAVAATTSAAANPDLAQLLAQQQMISGALQASQAQPATQASSASTSPLTLNSTGAQGMPSLLPAVGMKQPTPQPVNSSAPPSQKPSFSLAPISELDMMKLFASNTNATQPASGPMQKVQTQFLLASAQIDDKKPKDMGGGQTIQPATPVPVHPAPPTMPVATNLPVAPQQHPTSQQLGSPSITQQAQHQINQAQQQANANPQLKRAQPMVAQPTPNSLAPFNIMQSYQDQLLASMNSGPPPAKRHSISALPPTNIQPQQLASTLNHPLAALPLLQGGAATGFPPHFAAAAAQVAAQAAQQQLGKAGQPGNPYLSLPTIPPAFVLKQTAPLRPTLSNGVSPAASVASGGEAGHQNATNLLGLPDGNLNIQQLQHLLIQQQRQQLAAAAAAQQQQAVQQAALAAEQQRRRAPTIGSAQQLSTAIQQLQHQQQVAAMAFLQQQQQQQAALAAEQQRRRASTIGSAQQLSTAMATAASQQQNLQLAMAAMANQRNSPMAQFAATQHPPIPSAPTSEDVSKIPATSQPDEHKLHAPVALDPAAVAAQQQQALLHQFQQFQQNQLAQNRFLQLQQQMASGAQTLTTQIQAQAGLAQLTQPSPAFAQKLNQPNPALSQASNSLVQVATTIGQQNSAVSQATGLSGHQIPSVPTLGQQVTQAVTLAASVLPTPVVSSHPTNLPNPLPSLVSNPVATLPNSLPTLPAPLPSMPAPLSNIANPLASLATMPPPLSTAGQVQSEASPSVAKPTLSPAEVPTTQANQGRETASSEPCLVIEEDENPVVD